MNTIELIEMDPELVYDENELDSVIRLSKKLVARCDSDECLTAAGKKSGKVAAGIVKPVENHVTWCPDCEAALFWSKE